MNELYHRLTLADREEISRLESQGYTLTCIARTLSRSVSTISREMKLGHTSHGYRAFFASRKSARQTKLRRLHTRRMDQYPRLCTYVVAKLRLRWSPVQIAQTLLKEYPRESDMHISHESIYTYLYVLPRGTLKKELISYLRQGRKVRLKRRKKDRFYAQKITNMVSIEERPQDVSDRIIPGHWEGDLILGKQRKSCLGTLVERTTRSVLLVPLRNKKAPVVRQAFEKEMRTIPIQLRHTLTYDQGTEMAEHQLFARHIKMRVYFAHPSSPWERGTNENTNGLLRQFFPKNTDFTMVSRREIKHVQQLMNERPRKVLHWKTPKEVFTNLLR